MTKRRGHCAQVLKIAFAYVGTVVGAGFASGQEVMRFFTVYGISSTWAIAISALLFIWVGKQVLLLGRDVGATSFSGINQRIFGMFSPLVTGYLVLVMVVICTAMLAGSGALFEEYLGMNGKIGILITGLAAIVSMFFGVKGILSINSGIVPILIIFYLFVFISTLINFNVSQAPVEFIYGTSGDLIKTGISYAALNLVLSAGVLAPMGKEIDDPKVLTAGGILGGTILGCMLAAGNYCLWAHMPGIYNYEIPMVFIVGKMGSSFFPKLYAFVLWGGIFTTLIGNLFTIISIISEKTTIPPFITSLVVLGGGYFFSSLGFSGIVANLYPPLGLIGVIFMGMIIFSSLGLL